MSQNAKQFAAQQALEFLDKDQRRWRDAGADFIYPFAKPEPHRYQFDGSAQPPPFFNIGQYQEEQRQKEEKKEDFIINSYFANMDSTIIYTRINKLSSILLSEHPTYKITEDEPLGNNLWSGYAHFKPGSKAPEQLGEVKAILGKNEAKLKIAHRVLVWLEYEEEKRKQKIETVFSRNAGFAREPSGWSPKRGGARDM